MKKRKKVFKPSRREATLMSILKFYETAYDYLKSYGEKSEHYVEDIEGEKLREVFANTIPKYFSDDLTFVQVEALLDAQYMLLLDAHKKSDVDEIAELVYDIICGQGLLGSKFSFKAEEKEKNRKQTKVDTKIEEYILDEVINYVNDMGLDFTSRQYDKVAERIGQYGQMCIASMIPSEVNKVK